MSVSGAFGTHPGLRGAMLTQFLEAENPGGIAIHSQDAPQMPLGKAVKIVAGCQGRNMGENPFRQVEQIHNLSHAGAGNIRFPGNFGLCKRFVLGQHGLPFQSQPDRIQDAKFRCIFDIRLGFYIMAGGFRIAVLEVAKEKLLATV